MSHPIRPSNRSGQRGFSVVEIMVALAISLVLLAGVYKVYLGSKQSYRLTEGEARLQENGRFAMHFLTRTIRGAGYIGCANLDVIQPNIIVTNPPADLIFDTASVIRGYDSGTWPADFAKPANLVSGNSVILVRSASPISTQLVPTATMSSTTSSNPFVQVVGNPENWKTGDYLFVTDCAHADIFEATGVSSGVGTNPISIYYGTSVNDPSRLSTTYRGGSQMMAYHSHLFYLARSGSGTGNSLYEVSDGGTPEELVDNVQALSALYGVDTDGDKAANLYDSAAQVNARSTASTWPKVVSVRVSLVLRSPNDHVVARPQSYTYYDASQTPTTKVATDHRLYAVFNDTITLRNRMQ